MPSSGAQTNHLPKETSTDDKFVSLLSPGAWAVCSRANREAPGQGQVLGPRAALSRGRGDPPSRARPGPPAFGCSSLSGRWLEGEGAGLQRRPLCPRLLWHHSGGRAARLGTRPRLAHSSSLTVVQLGSWPHGARPEIGRLVWCRNRVSGTSWAFPTPAVTTFPYPLGRDRAGQMVPQNPPVCLQPGDSQTTGHFPQLEPSSTHPRGPGAGPASLTGLSESLLLGEVDRACPSHARTQSVLKTVGED